LWLFSCLHSVSASGWHGPSRIRRLTMFGRPFSCLPDCTEDLLELWLCGCLCNMVIFLFHCPCIQAYHIFTLVWGNLLSSRLTKCQRHADCCNVVIWHASIFYTVERMISISGPWRPGWLVPIPTNTCRCWILCPWPSSSWPWTASTLEWIPQ
jgi:hypothetical protein